MQSAEMTENGKPERSAPPPTHLSVRPDGRELFSFMQPEKQRIRGTLGAGFASHAVAIMLLILIARLLPDEVYQSVLPDRLPDIIWLTEPGPGGGGGGSPEPPPKKTVLPKPEKAPPPPVEVKPMPQPEPPKETPIPAQTVDVASVPALSAPESTQASNTTGGFGSGGGAGSGRGEGLGQGTDRGTGGGAFRPGNGVINPRVLREVKPAYTAEAMRAKVQGIVLLECIVLPDGTVGRVEILKSLDGAFGLDQEAVKAAKQWRFIPGTRFGEPVAVLVTIELTFTLR